MKFAIRDIAHLLEGEIDGNEELIIDKLGTLQNAKSGSLSFLANPKYENQLYSTEASVVLVKRDFQPDRSLDKTLIRVDDPYISFSILMDEYARMASFKKEGVEEQSHIGADSRCGKRVYRGAFSYIGEGVEIGDDVKIYPHVYIGDNVRIGNRCVLHPGVKVYMDVVIGNDCHIHAGAVLGSDGFGYAPQKDGSYKKIPQLGNVILEDHVEIGANTTVDCATLESTVIEKGAKLDNLIMIAHNVRIGENTAIAGQSGVSGSTSVGKNCIIAGQVGIVGHINLGDKITIGAQSGVTKSFKEGETILGSPAFEIADSRRSLAIFRKLPELQERIKKLEEKYMK